MISRLPRLRSWNDTVRSPLPAMAGSKGTLMRPYWILLAGLLSPAQALAADAASQGSVQGSIEISGYVPVSCRAAASATGGWSCNGAVQAIISDPAPAQTVDGMAISRLTVRPLV